MQGFAPLQAKQSLMYDFVLKVHVFSGFVFVISTLLHALIPVHVNVGPQTAQARLDQLRTLQSVFMNPFSLVSLLTGIFMVFDGGWGLFTGWLIVALILLFVYGGLLSNGAIATTKELQEQIDEGGVLDQHEDELKQLFGVRLVLLALALIIITLMETKPF